MIKERHHNQRKAKELWTSLFVAKILFSFVLKSNFQFQTLNYTVDDREMNKQTCFMFRNTVGGK